jgi:hypothetical protein
MIDCINNFRPDPAPDNYKAMKEQCQANLEKLVFPDSLSPSVDEIMTLVFNEKYQISITYGLENKVLEMKAEPPRESQKRYPVGSLELIPNNPRKAQAAALVLFDQYTNHRVIESWAKETVYKEILAALDLGFEIKGAERIGEWWIQKNCRVRPGSV